ncbi:hypothetical protein UA70_22110, partial [Raoultella planticola]
RRREIRVARVWGEERVIKTAGQQRVRMQNMMLITPEIFSARVCLGMPYRILSAACTAQQTKSVEVT